jgi:hypothetical protein
VLVLPEIQSQGTQQWACILTAIDLEMHLLDADQQRTCECDASKSYTNGSDAATISRQMVKSLTGINGLLMAFRMQGGSKQNTPQAT